jgi:hypothetical protein
MGLPKGRPYFIVEPDGKWITPDGIYEPIFPRNASPYGGPIPIAPTVGWGLVLELLMAF